MLIRIRKPESGSEILTGKIRIRINIPDPQHWNNSRDFHKNSDSDPNSCFLANLEQSKLPFVIHERNCKLFMMETKILLFLIEKFHYIYSKASMKCFQAPEETSRSPWGTSSSSNREFIFSFCRLCLLSWIRIPIPDPPDPMSPHPMWIRIRNFAWNILTDLLRPV